MLAAKIKQISAETQQIKEDISDATMAQAPTNKKFWFIIQFSQLERGTLSAAYYDTGYQLRKLSAYATEKSERSLETILSTFKCVAETGKAHPFNGLLFNDSTRAVIRALL